MILKLQIVKWRQYLDLNNRIGEKLSLECIDVIRKLCCEQEDRLGCKNGAEDLKIHPWFKVRSSLISIIRKFFLLFKSFLKDYYYYY